MAKRKNTRQDTAIDEDAQLVEYATSVKETAEPQPVEEISTENEPAPTQTPEPKPTKRRIRIRKKATKKLSAAIICMDPSIQRFI